MTQDDKTYQQKKSDLLEEICDNTRAIRRVTNRILDHLHEYGTTDTAEENPSFDPEELDWEALENNDDMYS